MVTNKKWILKLKEQLFSKDYQLVLYHHEEIFRAKKTVFEIEEEIEGSRLKINPRSQQTSGKTGCTYTRNKGRT